MNRYKIIDVGFYQTIRKTAGDNFEANTFTTFNEAKKSLRESFSTVLNDYRWALHNLNSLRKKDIE